MPAIAFKATGAASAFGILLIGVMVIMLGMTIDLGYIHLAQSELKRTSDAAALAACWALFDAKDEGLSNDISVSEIFQSASEIARKNIVAKSSPEISEQSGDVTIGSFDAATNRFTADTSNETNAVRVSVHRRSNSNGEVPLFFGMVLGRQSQPLSSTSTAALIRNIGGFHTPSDDSESINLLPFALDEVTWQAVLNQETDDSLSWLGKRISSTPNGRHECNLFPQGTGSPGNRGTVDIGSSNNSTRDIARQIISGITQDDLVRMNKPFEFDVNGELFLNGDTGISAGVKDELQSIVGQKRIIPIFREVNGNGNNATYTIVKFAGVRIMEVKLTGPMDQKRIIVEPAPTVGRYARINFSEQSSSDFVYAPVMLVN